MAEVFATGYYKFSKKQVGFKIYTPRVVYGGKPRFLRLSFYRATFAEQYGQRVAARYNKIFGM